MNLTPIKANMTELTIGTKLILFSYKTPVAILDLGKLTNEYVVTSKKWSRTTSRHISTWIKAPAHIIYKPQEYFDNLLAEVR